MTRLEPRVPVDAPTERTRSEDMPKALGPAFTPGARRSPHRFAEFAREYHP